MKKASKISLLKSFLDSAEASIRSARSLISDVKEDQEDLDFSRFAKELGVINEDSGQNIVEGVFDGERMVDSTGKEYAVPANYASKSKLIPGDVLKLTIEENGGFKYKQIKPTERKSLIGTLTFEDGEYKVIAEGKAYNVLLASVTYFKVEIGDKVTLIVPAEYASDWGAIENVLPREPDSLPDDLLD